MARLQVALTASEANLRAIIMRAAAVGTELVLMTPPPILDPGNNPKITQQIALAPNYIAMHRRLAHEHGLKLIDVYAAFSALRAIDPGLFTSLYMDPWHLTAAGHKFLAALFMASWLPM